ncbi:MAG: 3-deoxy-manno-octulosonate cytidylyltransferase [Bacteroidetes bacterium]|nr:MAG: 3-deoxy-manno-octulosonate cytidylyltransferase [Bacteroidota bacterium]RLD43807.1 MAG: 3-deoxy-manno-octulosonate cytidylyltransferase [Bacteroidota bacterium]RLD70940.1 MAG: 3-deoxy-manno-octulosonate cytidylyltransferase [Bacteroidota bacterium]RLD89807.1 MAG: 3-deoxy-manno-octulosonate cytidylyltransferase [Bacteroidota bacterium]HHL57656.1 3-deoxy-manno-octulosonate cytidylyltransferase [Bacteroidota bacterium]
MAVLGIIPARYASTRFPGKPLARIHGKSMIRRVYEQCLLAEKPDKIIVATDDERIFNHVRDFGGEVVMTGQEHPNGTSRCAEALSIIEKETGKTIDFVINIQGDEPYINPAQIDKVASLLEKAPVHIATLGRKIGEKEDLFDPNVVKLVTNRDHKALYFSRQPVPYVRDAENDQWPLKADFYKHIGIYGYKRDVLQEIVRLSPGKLEIAERLEQLRWMEYGYDVYVDFTDFDSISVDTPDDLLKFTNNP